MSGKVRYLMFFVYIGKFAYILLGAHGAIINDNYACRIIALVFELSKKHSRQ
jgi:hypothetical protein